MRLVLLVAVVSASAAFALPGEQVSKITLLADDSVKSLSLPPPPVQPLPMSGLGSEPLSKELKLRLIAMEMRTLRFARNDVGGPLFLTLLGGTGVFGGLTAFAIAAAGVGYTASIIGLIMLMVAGGPLLIGLPWLLVALGHNAKIDQELHKLEAEAASLGGVTQRDAPRPAALVARF